VPLGEDYQLTEETIAWGVRYR